MPNPVDDTRAIDDTRAAQNAESATAAMRDDNAQQQHRIVPLDESPVAPFPYTPPEHSELAKYFSTYAKELGDMRIGVQSHPNYDPAKHDTLFFFRFLFKSNWKTVPAIKAVQQALTLRAKYKLDELANYAWHTHPRHGPSGPWPGAYTMFDKDKGSLEICGLRYQPGMRNFVVVGKLASMNQHYLAQHLDDYILNSKVGTEYFHQALDALSRKTGRLIRASRIFDLTDMSPSRVNNKLIKADSDMVDYISDIYPTDLNQIFYCNAPGWAQFMYDHVIKHFLSKRTREKVQLLQPKTRQKDKQKLLALVAEESLPAFAGGTVLTEWPPLAEDWHEFSHKTGVLNCGISHGPLGDWSCPVKDPDRKVLLV